MLKSLLLAGALALATVGGTLASEEDGCGERMRIDTFTVYLDGQSVSPEWGPWIYKMSDPEIYDDSTYTVGFIIETTEEWRTRTGHLEHKYLGFVTGWDEENCMLFHRAAPWEMVLKQYFAAEKPAELFGIAL